MEEDGDRVLKKTHLEVSMLVGANPEPMGAARIAREFDEIYCEPINFTCHGYMTLTAFLDDHPKLDAVIFNGMKCYKARLSDNSDARDIQSLIGKQRKKKRNRGGKRGGFQRNSGFTRSDRYQPKAPFQNFARSSLREPYVPTGRRSAFFQSPSTRSSHMEFGSSAINQGGFGGPPLSPGMRRDGVFSRLSIAENRDSFTGQPRCSEKGDPTVGVTRIMSALKNCSGRASYNRVSDEYQKLFGCPLTGEELTKFFGTNNLKKIETSHLRGQVVITALPGGRFIFSSQKMLDDAQEMVKKQGFTIIHKAELKFEKPSLATLKDHLIKILENIHPRQLPLADLSTIYHRAHGVHVDPEVLFRKSWTELIAGTMKQFFVLDKDETIGLTKPFITNLIRKRKNQMASTVVPARTIFNAEQMGLAYESDSDDESDTETGSVVESNGDISSLGSTIPDICNSSPVKTPVVDDGDSTPICMPRSRGFGFLKKKSIDSNRTAVSMTQQEVNLIANIPSMKLSETFRGATVLRSDNSSVCASVSSSPVARPVNTAGFVKGPTSEHLAQNFCSTSSKPVSSANKVLGAFRRLGFGSSKTSEVKRAANLPSSLSQHDSFCAPANVNPTIAERHRSFIIRFHGKGKGESDV